ncbi:MAG: hypothetical protein ACK5HY_02060, partial [Parahaliea sp.]
SGVFWRMDKSREHPAFAWIMQVAPRLCSSYCTKNVHAFALKPLATSIQSTRYHAMNARRPARLEMVAIVDHDPATGEEAHRNFRRGVDAAGHRHRTVKVPDNKKTFNFVFLLSGF